MVMEHTTHRRQRGRRWYACFAYTVAALLCVHGFSELAHADAGSQSSKAAASDAKKGGATQEGDEKDDASEPSTTSVRTRVEPVDFDEITTVRVLERELLPSDDTRVEQLEMGFGVPAEDRLALGGAPPVELLVQSGQEDGSTSLRTDRTLQVQLDHSLAAALEQIRRDLAPYRGEDKAKLDLPFGIDCTELEAVESYLALFTDRGARTLRAWIQRAQKWRPMIERILDEEGVPRDLLYLAMIESGYRTTAVSPASATGMWQFMSGTARDMGLRVDRYVDERNDPVKATRAAARYLKRQYRRFGNWPLAMAAYNGGAGTVAKGIRTYNSNDYFKLVEYGAMYNETRRYVPKILAAALIAKNPEAFGFGGLTGDPEWRYDEVEVPGDTRLSLLAQAAGTSMETLQSLNPELVRKQTPPDVDTYVL